MYRAQRYLQFVLEISTDTTFTISHYLIQNIIIRSGQYRMTLRNQRQQSAPPRQIGQLFNSDDKKVTTVTQPKKNEVKELILRFDINMLLSLFNEMETSGTGEVPRRGVRKIMQTIGLYNCDHLLKHQNYTFDHFLSLIGQIEVPNEPSIYVLSFVKILANYRDKCIQRDELGLQEAKQVQQKIRSISLSQVQRKKMRIKMEHSKIYEEMHFSQEKQFRSFEEEWKNYLREFQVETSRRLQETKYLKKSKIIQQENKFINKIRKNNIITSPRLRELIERKKLLIKQKKYENAIEINLQIERQKYKLSEYKQQANDQILNKKLQKLTSNTNRYLGAVEKNLEVNLNRLVSKKKEGENIMKIRMKNLREEANRKLNEHYRTEIHRLRSSFYIAANH